MFNIRSENGIWKNVYTKKPVDLSFGVTGNMGAYGEYGQCGAFIRSGWDNFPCTINKAQPIHCACQHPRQIVLQLRGLCPNTNLDKYYIPMNKEKSGNVIYYGKSLNISWTILNMTLLILWRYLQHHHWLWQDWQVLESYDLLCQGKHHSQGWVFLCFLYPRESWVAVRGRWCELQCQGCSLQETAQVVRMFRGTIHLLRCPMD